MVLFLLGFSIDCRCLVSNNKKLVVPVLFALYAAAAMSAGPVFVKKALEHLPPFFCIALAASLASLSLFILLAIAGRFPSFKGNSTSVLKIFLFFILFQALPGIIWFHTLPHLSGIFAVVIKRIQPLVIALLSIVLVGRRLRSTDIPLSLLALGGLYLIALGRYEGTRDPLRLFYVLAALSCVFLWATQFLYARKLLDSFDSVQANAIGMFAYAVSIFPFALIQELPSMDDYVFSSVASVCFVGIGVFGFGVASIFKALSELEPWTVSMIMLVGPVFGAVAAYFLLGESISNFQVFGVLLVIVSMAMAIHLEEKEKKYALPH